MRSQEEILRLQIGGLFLQIVALQAEVEQLKDQLTRPKDDTPA